MSLQESVTNQQDYVELVPYFAHVCKTLDQRLTGGRLDKLSRSVLEVIQQLTILVRLATYKPSDFPHQGLSCYNSSREATIAEGGWVFTPSIGTNRGTRC